ncbi:MAG: acetylxylan esterase [Cryobacterium sp.]|uniref:acetylxylan esterase n=1 Tax=unclassified Cryobacterium TaxID=2649013 RepID=UPI0018CB402B|nr:MULTISPECIES: acetylxylan esterase [unclassified Cryobacterium]MCY7403813.1 acetylxylan esterase [Cryobacterium sp.]MEC5154216.1 cephalosporin-C deacetylase-like acetyl esterase [Cryobacterium sp. CAN_C3]
MYTDLPEADLRRYVSAQADPADFDLFWAGTLAETEMYDLNVTVTQVDAGLITLDVFDVTFCGYGGQRVKAWLRVPAGTTDPMPAIVQFHGYGRGRGQAFENLLWASAGFAHFEMDVRGQGFGGSTGDTDDDAGSGPQVPGFMTRGIGARETYYYRRVFADAVRAVAAARSLDLVDAARVGVTGVSQGGGIALAVAGLVPELAAVVARVPFLCDFPRASVITDALPYRELGQYLATNRLKVKRVHDVLAYFDGVNFAKRATAPVIVTAALMDQICPPSTVFAAYNNYAGPKQITLWPYNGHEGGAWEDDALALRAFREHLA